MNPTRKSWQLEQSLKNYESYTGASRQCQYFLHILNFEVLFQFSLWCT